MKLYFHLIILSFLLLKSTSVYSCGSLFLSEQYSSKNRIALQKKIEEAKLKIKSLKKIKSQNDFLESETFFLEQRFPNYLQKLKSKERVKVSQKILVNQQIGIIKSNQKKLYYQKALKVYQGLSKKKQEFVAQTINQNSLKKKTLRKQLLKNISKKQAKIILKAIVNKKICCLKKCSKCPVNYPSFKLEQKYRK